MDLELYARILAELARGQIEPSRVLAQHGLDPASWSALSARCEDALDVPDESNDASLLERFAKAFAQAQSELAGGPASFDEWLGVLSAMQKGEALPAALERLQLTLDRYLATQAHWAERVAKEPELKARMQAALGPHQRR